MKRLLCLIGSMNTGGAETFLMKVYRKLDRTKYQMDFCVNVEEQGFYDDEIRSLGGKFFYVPPKTKDYKGFRKGLKNLIVQEKYEYVFRIASNAISFMDLQIAKKAGAKVCSLRSSNSSDGNGFKAWLAHKVGFALYNRYVDVKFAPSDLAAEYTFGKKAVQKGEVSILHNGVDLDIFRFDETARKEIRQEFGLSDEQLLVGHIGRFMTQKNHAFLLNVFKKISEKNENAVLMLVGKGELENEIKEKIKTLGLQDKVIFTGVRADISKLLSAMDVFVFPSLYEGMPNTIIEAQATGLPCVIADTITKEADITGLVKYLPLSATTDTWANMALESVTKERKDTKQDFIDHKYDVESVVEEFVSLVFQEK